MSKDIKFIKGIYDDIDEELEEVYEAQEENKKTIFNNIAMILFIFFISDSFLKLTNKDIEKNEVKLNKLITDMFSNIKNLTTNKTEIILNKTANKIFSFYGGKELTNKQLKNIVKRSFKNKTFSKRIWANENKISKLLKKDINKFLKGKISVNDIKTHLDNKFKVEKYNIDRLVNTELSRVINDATLLYCKENGIKKVQYVAELDNRTCVDCKDYDSEIYEIDNLPFELPQHANCRCYWRPFIE